MIQLLQRLRSDEEGQVLVLGAIFGLVLMLCVLSTVNLGRAVYAKVQLQTAADAAAYSQAAVEARVLNFTAYTNRAMVVHYASIMAAAAYLAWVHFLWAAIDPVLSLLKNVPYAGPVFATLQQVFRGLLVLLDTAVAVMMPLVSAACSTRCRKERGSRSERPEEAGSRGFRPRRTRATRRRRPTRRSGQVWCTPRTRRFSRGRAASCFCPRTPPIPRRSCSTTRTTRCRWRAHT